MRAVVLLCLGLAAAGCGGGGSDAEYHAGATTTCLEKQAGVHVIPTPGSQLGQFPGATDVLDVSWSLTHLTPPPQAILMFARSAGDEPQMEQSLDQLVHTATGASVSRVLQRSRNVAWAWIGKHRPADDAALRRCLS